MVTIAKLFPLMDVYSSTLELMLEIININKTRYSTSLRDVMNEDRVLDEGLVGNVFLCT